MKIGGVCVFCIKKMWQVIATLLVITAVIISVLKYSLPHIGSYSDDIQNWVRDEYGAEIYIGNISAGWDGIGPAVILQNISFLPNESAPLDLVIQETRIKVDFWASLQQRELTSDYFVLDGVIATVDGNSLIQTTNEDPNVNNAPILDALSHLFLGQLKQFRVENSTIKLNTPSGEVQDITIDELTWYNDKLLHQGVGEFQLGDFASNSLSFILDLQGETRHDLAGQLFVEATELDISPWLSQFVSNKSEINNSNVNFTSWTTINNGVVEQAQISLGDNELEWTRDKSKHQFIFGQGQMIWTPIAQGWSLRSNNIQFGSQQHLDSTHFSLDKKRDGLALFASQWSVARSKKLLSLLDVEPQVSEALAQYQPSGLVHDLYLQLDSIEQWQLTGLFADVGWKNVGDTPGAEGLSGHFGMNSHAGWIKVEGVEGRLLTGQLFKQPLAYENIEFKLSFWQDQDKRWQLHGKDIWFHNNDIDIVAEFSLEFDPDANDAGNLALYAEMSGSDLSVADKYYPPEYMGQESIDYLNGAIKAGSLEMAQVLWSGDIGQFPYGAQQGVFLAHTQVSDVDFLFAPGWPVLSNVDGLLVFRDDTLTITPQKGYFLDLEIGEKAQAVIPELSESLWLDLSVDTIEEPSKVAKMFKATPLRDIFEPVFEELTIFSPVHAQALIRIPLVEDEQEFDRLLNYQGQVVINENALTIETPGIELSEVKGVLSFDVDKIWMDDMEANWNGQPLQAKLLGRQEQDYRLNIEASTTVQTDTLLKRLNDPLQAHVSGLLTAEAQIALLFPEQGVNYQIEVDADVDGLELKFPAPYNKSVISNQADKGQMPFKVSITGDEDSLLATANFADKLYFNGILPHNQTQFSQAHLILADKDMGLAGDGFKISVDIAEAELMPWYDFVDHLVSHVSDRQAEPVLPSPSFISGKIGKLNGFGHRLNSVTFDLTEGNGSWDLDLSAKETRTQIHFDRDWAGKGITIKTDYLRLVANDDEPESESMTDSDQFIASLPPIDFSCDDCRYNQYDLQRVEIETQTVDHQLNFTKFNIFKGRHQFQSSGYWLGDKGTGVTSISGRLSSDNIGLLLDEYELTAAVRDSDAKIDLLAHWTGGPHQFNLPSLGGEIKWRMGEGHLTEVSDRGSRILSLLSLDSIVRKLKLDFRDVFSKGFFYNSMQGTMLVENGIAYTDNTEIDGVPGDLNMQGNVNLMAKELDYEFIFYPKVTSSLPVIIGWMVNPISGIAALALDKMLESTKVIAQVHFSVTGTIEDPVVTETERTSRDIQIPKTAVRPMMIPQSDPALPGKFKEQPTPTITPVNEANAEINLPTEALTIEPEKKDETGDNNQ